MKNNNNIVIVDTVELHRYTKLKDLYQHLLSLRKDRFADNERIIFTHNPADTKILNLIKELLEFIDIPDFFIIFKSRNSLPPAKLDFIPSQTHCFYAWTNLVVLNDGEIRPCCSYQESINDKGAFIQTDDLITIHKSEYMISLRKQFENGIRPSGCSSCWTLEDNGSVSMRTAAKYKFKELYYNIDYAQNDTSNLKVLDLKMGSECNLSCRICSEKCSTSIAKFKLDTKAIDHSKFISIQNKSKWAIQEETYKQLVKVSKNIKHLDLYGGEPLMIKNHFNYLKELIQTGLAKEINLDYNSNGSFYSESFFEIWDQFASVKISFSIDNIGKRFELERNGVSWDKVQNNIKKFVAKQSSKFMTDVYPTISILNVFYLPELIDWIIDQKFSSLPTINNIVYYPNWLSINALTHSAKNIVLQKLNNYHNPHVNIDHIVNLVKRVSGVETNESFLKNMQQLDSYRNQNFLDTHYEIAIAMGYQK